MLPQRLLVDASAWGGVPHAWGLPRAGGGPDGSTTPSSSPDDPSDRPPSPACAHATSGPQPPPSPDEGSRAPSGSYRHPPQGTSPPSTSPRCGPAPGHGAPAASSRPG